MSSESAKPDRTAGVENDNNKGLRYIDIDFDELRVSGFAFRKKGEPFSRMPCDRKLPKAVTVLARNTAGGRIDFVSNTTRIWLKVKLKEAGHMDHMPDTGSCGFDLYMGEPGKSYFIGTSRAKTGADIYESRMHNFLFDGEMHNFTLNMPLYSGVKSVKIGIDEDAEILPPAPWSDERPLVIYGTSITQGGCASRPGMAYTAILGRRFNRPVLNFGFSGSGRGEAVVAASLAKVADPGAFILDYDANTNLEEMKNTLEAFISVLRTAHPSVPLIVISGPRYNREIILSGDVDTPMQAKALSAEFQENTVKKLRDAGDENIYFVNGGKLYGEKWHELSVDGVHATDAGFLIYAENLSKILAEIL